mmetsp:Transcript_12729/g.27929  ORF Transcript_12729/g.27929 Transcript_12729/m.27929 type:complete len:461 (-) Transcript_12729:660-2042(-)
MTKLGAHQKTCIFIVQDRSIGATQDRTKTTQFRNAGSAALHLSAAQQNGTLFRWEQTFHQDEFAQNTVVNRCDLVIFNCHVWFQPIHHLGTIKVIAASFSLWLENVFGLLLCHQNGCHSLLVFLRHVLSQTVESGKDTLQLLNFQRRGAVTQNGFQGTRSCQGLLYLFGTRQVVSQTRRFGGPTAFQCFTGLPFSVTKIILGCISGPIIHHRHLFLVQVLSFIIGGEGNGQGARFGVHFRRFGQFRQGLSNDAPSVGLRQLEFQQALVDRVGFARLHHKQDNGFVVVVAHESFLIMLRRHVQGLGQLFEGRIFRHTVGKVIATVSSRRRRSAILVIFQHIQLVLFQKGRHGIIVRIRGVRQVPVQSRDAGRKGTKGRSNGVQFDLLDLIVGVQHVVAPKQAESIGLTGPFGRFRLGLDVNFLIELQQLCGERVGLNDLGESVLQKGFGCAELVDQSIEQG